MKRRSDVWVEQGVDSLESVTPCRTVELPDCCLRTLAMRWKKTRGWSEFRCEQCKRDWELVRG